MPNTSVKPKARLRLAAGLLALALGAGWLPGLSPVLAQQAPNSAIVQSAATDSTAQTGPDSSAGGSDSASAESGSQPQPDGASSTPADSGSSAESGSAGESVPATDNSPAPTDDGGAYAPSSLQAQPDGFVLDEAQNESLPTLFADAAPAADVQTWMDVGAALSADQQPKGDSSLTAAAGTKENPYLITTPEQLGWLAYQVNVKKQLSLCGKLVCDISLKGRQWVPIGYGHAAADNAYQGTFDGNGYYIDYLTITPESTSAYGTKDGKMELGFFGTLVGTAKNLMMRNATITSPKSPDDVTGRYCCMGGIVGQVYDGGTVLNCGFISGTFTLRGKWYWPAAGGIAGDLHTAGSIKNCFSRLSVDTSACTATGSYGICAGGLAGRSNTSDFQIESCYVASSFNGTGHILIGTVTKLPNTLTACYYEDKNIAAANKQTLNGLTARTAGSMQNSADFVKLLNGSQGTIWYNDRRDINDGYPLPAYQQEPSWEDIGQLLPEAEQPQKVNGVYQIGNADQLAWFMYAVNKRYPEFRNANACLTADIDLKGGARGGTEEKPFLWMPIGSSFSGISSPEGASGQKAYIGRFNGQGHTVSNVGVYFSGHLTNGLFDNELGFFGSVGAGGVIENLYIENTVIISPNISDGFTINAGGLVGVLCGVMRNCGVLSGSLTNNGGTWSITSFGGAIGSLRDEGVAENCFARATVRVTAKPSDVSSSGVGGFLGRAVTTGTGARVSSCYAAGACSASYAGDPFARYFRTGSTFQNCYVLSTMGSSSHAVGKTESELKSMAFVANELNTAFPRQWFYDLSTKNFNQGYPVPLGGYWDWSDIGQQVQNGLLAACDANGQPTGALVAKPALQNGAYQITSPEQLGWALYMLRSGNRGISITLAADIDLTGAAYGGTEQAPVRWLTPCIGHGDTTTSYTGTLDGKGHTLSYLWAYADKNGDQGSTLDETPYIEMGMFGVVQGTVKNLLFDHANIRSVANGEHLAAGVVAGQTLAGSTLQNVGVLNTCEIRVTGNRKWVALGGLTGDLHSAGSGQTLIQTCFSRAAIDFSGSQSHTQSAMGGLVGRAAYNIHQLKNCYAVAKLSGSGSIPRDAFIGYNSGGRFTYTYTDKAASGVSRVSGATALTTEQMKSLAALENLNKNLTDSAGKPYEAFVYDAANENSGYPLLVFGRTAAGEAFFTTNGSTITVAPSLAAGEVLIPANVTGTASASIKADSTFTSVFQLSSYMPGVAAGKDSTDTAANPYPTLQNAVLNLGAGGLPKGTAIVLAYRDGTKTGDTYNRTYAKYTAAATIANGQVALTAFTLPDGASLTLAHLLKLAKQQLVVYVDYTGVALADNAKHTGSISLVCEGANGTKVLAGSHDLTAPSTMPTLAASDPAAPAAYALALASAAAGSSFDPGDLKLTVTYSGGSQAADNAKGVALGAVVCLKDENGDSQPLDNVTFSTDGGATWIAPSNAYYMIVPASGNAFYVHNLTDAQAQQLTAQLYASAAQIDKTLPRGAYLVAQAKDKSSTETAASYALRAEAKTGDDRVYEVNTAGNSLTVLLSARPEPLPSGCTLGVQLLKKQTDGSYAQAGGLLSIPASKLATGENTLQLAGSATAGTYRLLFTLYDPNGTAVASAPFNILLRQEARSS